MNQIVLDFEELQLVPNASILANGTATIDYEASDFVIRGIEIDSVYLDGPRTQIYPDNPLWSMITSALIRRRAQIEEEIRLDIEERKGDRAGDYWDHRHDMRMGGDYAF